MDFAAFTMLSQTFTNTEICLKLQYNFGEYDKPQVHLRNDSVEIAFWRQKEIARKLLFFKPEPKGKENTILYKL